MNNHGRIGLRSSKDNWFTCVDTAVLMDGMLSTSAKQVFFILCAIAGFGSRSCSPANNEVAQAAFTSEERLLRMYEELEDRGVIIRDGKTIYIIGHNAPCYEEDS